MIGRLMDMQILFYCMIGTGVLGAIGMFIVNRTYKRRMKLMGHLAQLKEKWLQLWTSRDVLLRRMNRWVWYPSLACVAIFGAALILNRAGGPGDGVPMRYVYAGMAVPIGLLLLRQALDFSYKEELILGSLADYIQEAREEMEEKEIEEIPLQAQDEIVEHITRSIKESAVTRGRYSQLLTPEEEEIMREVIKEFMV